MVDLHTGVDALHDLVTAECHRAYGADAAGDLAVASLDALDRGGEAPPRFVRELAFAGLVLVAQALMVLQCVPAYVRDALARPRPSGSASSRPKTLSVVVPAHNEARGLEPCGNQPLVSDVPPNFEILYLGQIEVDSADFWTDRLLLSSFRSTAEVFASKHSNTRTLKSG